MKYKLIIFDADETLFDFRMSEQKALEITMKEFGAEYDESYHLPIYKDVNHRIWKEFEDGILTQETLKTERFKRYFDKLSVDYDIYEFSSSYIKNLGEGAYLFKDSEELVRKLSKTHRLIILTNGLSKVQNRRIEKSGIKDCFEEIVISEEVGAAKPSKEIFEYAIRNFEGVDKSQILMVGDSMRSDILGGINYGIDTCWYNPTKSENKESFLATYEISSLFEIIDIV